MGVESGAESRLNSMNKKTPFARVAAKGRGRVLFQKRPAKEIPRARGKGGGPDPPKLSGNVTCKI